jgi:hypothetical protein
MNVGLKKIRILRRKSVMICIFSRYSQKNFPLMDCSQMYIALYRDVHLLYINVWVEVGSHEKECRWVRDFIGHTPFLHSGKNWNILATVVVTIYRQTTVQHQIMEIIHQSEIKNFFFFNKSFYALFIQVFQLSTGGRYYQRQNLLLSWR